MTRAVRPATLLDVYALRRMPFSPVGGAVGRLEDQCHPGPLATLLALTAGFGGHRLYVSAADRRLEGALHVTTHAAAGRWNIVRTAGQQDDADWLVDLLQAVTAAAAAASIEKLVTRMEHDDPRLVSFEEAGFRPYAQETVYGVDLVASAPLRESAGGRPFRNKDEWAMQRLYNGMTPPNVSNMERLAPRDALEPFVGGAGLVVECDGEVLALAGYRPRHPRDAALVHLLARPGAGAAAETALITVLERLHRRGVRTVWLPIRDYMADCLAAARGAGLAPLLTRVVLVKHTAALVRPHVFGRLREVPATMPAVNGSRLVHNRPPQCRLRHEGRPHGCEAPASVA